MRKKALIFEIKKIFRKNIILENKIFRNVVSKRESFVEKLKWLREKITWDSLTDPCEIQSAISTFESHLTEFQAFCSGKSTSLPSFFRNTIKAELGAFYDDLPDGVLGRF